MNRRLFVGVVFGAASALAALGGCSVPTQGDARRVPDAEVPFGLVGSTPSSTTPTASATPGVDVVVYLARDGRLVGVDRRVTVNDLDARIGALVAGPTDGEADEGIRTALVGDPVRSVSQRHDVVSVDLDARFTETSPAEQRLALAQLTYTVTEGTEAAYVSYRLDGKAISVPRGDGTTSDGPVNRSDYARIGP